MLRNQFESNYEQMLQETWMISKKCMRKILWMDLIKTLKTLENNHQTIWTICQFTEEG